MAFVGLAIDFELTRQRVSEILSIVESAQNRNEILHLVKSIFQDAILPPNAQNDFDELKTWLNGQLDVTVKSSGVSEYVTVKHLADMYKRDIRTISRWCREGRFPGAERVDPNKPRKGWRIPRAALVQFRPPEYTYKDKE